MRNSPGTTSLAYRLLLTRGEDAKVPTGRPSAPWHNAVLTTRRERDDAIAQVKRLGLPVVSDSSKNWDTLAALDCIFRVHRRALKSLTPEPRSTLGSCRGFSFMGTRIWTASISASGIERVLDRSPISTAM